MTRFAMALCAAVVVSLTLVGGSPAKADTGVMHDPGPDVEHEGQGRLNMRSARHLHDGRLVIHKLKFWTEWGSRLLAPSRETQLLFRFETHYSDCGSMCPNPEADAWHGFIVQIQWRDGHLIPTVVEAHDRGPSPRSIRITRPDRYTIKLGFPADSFSHYSYTWSASATDPDCGGESDGVHWDGCSDGFDEMLEHILEN